MGLQTATVPRARLRPGTRDASEKDGLEVLRLMKATYKVDESRICLNAHSMGAIGPWSAGANATAAATQPQ